MIYLVGGCSRSGKTSVALRMLKDCGVPYLSTDVLMMGLRGAGFAQYANEVDDIEVAASLQTILAPMVANLIDCGVPYLLEGVYLRPTFIGEMVARSPDFVTGCVLGYPDLPLDKKLVDIIDHPSESNDWLAGEGDTYRRSFISRQLEISRIDQAEAEAASVPFFDTGAGHSQGVDAAFACLTA